MAEQHKPSWAMIGRPFALQSVIAAAVGVLLGLASLLTASQSLRVAPLLAIAILAPFIAMIGGGVRRLCLAIIVLDIPLQLDANLFYRYDAAGLGALGGLNLSATTVALAILYALWAGELLAGPPQPRAPLALSWPPLVYLAFVILSARVAGDGELAGFEIALLVQMYLMYLYIIGTVRDRSDLLFIVTLLVAGLAFESALVIGMAALGHNVNIPGIKSSVWIDNRGGPARFGGTLGSPNTAAAYLSLLLAPAIGLLLVSLGPWRRRLALLALGLGIIALVLTFSRSGWLALFLSAGALCLLPLRRWWLSAQVPIAAAAVALLLALLFQHAIVTRLLGDDEGSAQGRLPLMRLAWRMIRDHMIWGVGANNFAVTIKQYATPDFDGGWLYTVHNQYLLAWAEKGLGGLAALLTFLLVTLRRGWRGWQQHDRALAPLALAFALAIAGHMVHMLTDFFNERPVIQLLWLSAALIAAISQIEPAATPARPVAASHAR